MEDVPHVESERRYASDGGEVLAAVEGHQDRRERDKLLDYAMAYAQLAQQLKQRETSRAMVRGDGGRADASERGGSLARSHGR
jgi:hypothetical protein